MHVTMPDKSKRTTFTLASIAHLEGQAGPRRPSGRIRDARRPTPEAAAEPFGLAEGGVGGGVKGADRGLQNQDELDHRRPVPWPQWGLDDVARGGEVQVGYCPGTLR